MEFVREHRRLFIIGGLVVAVLLLCCCLGSCFNVGPASGIGGGGGDSGIEIDNDHKKSNKKKTCKARNKKGRCTRYGMAEQVRVAVG